MTLKRALVEWIIQFFSMTYDLQTEGRRHQGSMGYLGVLQTLGAWFAVYVNRPVFAGDNNFQGNGAFMAKLWSPVGLRAGPAGNLAFTQGLCVK